VVDIDSVQALHLAMQCAGAVLESAKLELEWLGQREDFGDAHVPARFAETTADRLEAIPSMR
jgi:hypothetical protein